MTTQFKNSRSARRLTGDFTDSLPLALGAKDLVKAPSANEILETVPTKKSATTTFRVKSISNAKKFPFTKAQLTISLESEKVRSSDISDTGVRGLVGQSISFDTDPYVERSPTFRIKEKEVCLSPDFGRTGKIGEGTGTFTTEGQFPKELVIDITVRDKIVGSVTFEVLYRNLDLDQIIEDCKRGRINGFKNFQVDGGLEVVQEAAVEWVNCLQPAIDVINYTLTNTEIGPTCTVWYKVRRAELPRLKQMQSLQTDEQSLASSGNSVELEERKPSSSSSDLGSSGNASPEPHKHKSPRTKHKKPSSPNKERKNSNKD